MYAETNSLRSECAKDCASNKRSGIAESTSNGLEPGRARPTRGTGLPTHAKECNEAGRSGVSKSNTNKKLSIHAKDRTNNENSIAVESQVKGAGPRCAKL